MSQLERLGLMRNPKLSMYLVVALFETPSSELNMSQDEHAALLVAAAVNPNLIQSSRRTGRKAWIGMEDANPPFEEYGKMWNLCVEKWMDKGVAYMFIKYIQTTREVKQDVYKRLLEQHENSDNKCYC